MVNTVEGFSDVNKKRMDSLTVINCLDPILQHTQQLPHRRSLRKKAVLLIRKTIYGQTMVQQLLSHI